jgi:hypothetical protein
LSLARDRFNDHGFFVDLNQLELLYTHLPASQGKTIDMAGFCLYILNMKNRGRPKSESINKKGVRLDLRVSELERQGFKEAADISGIPLSAWIRQRLRWASTKELKDMGKDVPFLREH